MAEISARSECGRDQRVLWRPEKANTQKRDLATWASGTEIVFGKGSPVPALERRSQLADLIGAHQLLPQRFKRFARNPGFDRIPDLPGDLVFVFAHANRPDAGRADD